MKRKVFLIILVFLINILWVNAIGVTNKLSEKYNIVINTKNPNKNNNNPNIIDDLDVLLNADLTYEGENADIIAKKIDQNLKDEMHGYGTLISKYAISNDINPYLIASMIIETTNCDLKCSVLVKQCNNVYEALYNKDSINQTSCFGGNYQKFSSLDDSIKSFIKFVKTNFYDKDLKTTNSIASSYNKDARWIFVVNQNISKIKNSSLA